ncbi:MAG: hypothetical protein ACJA1F_001308 [Paracoccaceae bacterium]|jgi:hypothetical protein
MPSHELIAILPGRPKALAIEDVEFIQNDDFTAVLRRIPRRLLKLPQSRHTRLRAAGQRQLYLETLMSSGTVLPALPDILLDPQEAVTLLRTNSPMLERLSQRMEQRIQYQITIEWQVDKILEHFRTAPEIAPLFENGPTSVKSIEAAVSKMRDRLNTQISTLLQTACEDMIGLPHDNGVLWNMVVLTTQNDQFALDQAIEAIDAIWTDGFRIRQIGPAPAGSFTSLSLDRISWKTLDDALAVLDLQDWDGVEDVRRIRHRLLKQQRQKAANNDANLHEIRNAAHIIEAARRAGNIDTGELLLLREWSEGQAAVTEDIERQVA